jgi:hypothetical protein
MSKKQTLSRYERLKKAGKCVDCGKHAAQKDKTQCGPCIESTAKRAAKRAKQSK